MRLLTALAALALLLVIVAAAAPPGAPARTDVTSGFRGTVTRGPTTPVCRVDIPCTAPADGVLLTFARAGAAARARTDDEGRYRITLPAGIYTVGVGPATAPRKQRPVPYRVKVRAGHVDRLDFFIDTGIR